MNAVRVSVNEWSTRPANGVLDDIEQIGRAGFDGIGLWEGKFGDVDDGRIVESLAEHDLAAAFCVPRVWTILPVPFNRPGELRDPRERVDAMCESIPRLAKFDPEVIVIGPGVSGDAANPAGPIEAVHKGLGRVADVAAEHGLQIGFELLAERRGCPIATLPEIVDFIDDVGRENVGVMWDVWHSWCEPDVHERVRSYAHRINSVHINDVQVEERTSFDRALPGEGRGEAGRLIAALLEGGYDGWWEIEVFSDDGTFGMELSDSLWKLPPDEFLRRARAAFDATFADAEQAAASSR